jgi:hypothetical protein
MANEIPWPPPGSHEAVKTGCTCPVEDNKYGVGQPSSAGTGANYWIAKDCPLHGRSLPKEKPCS